MKMTYTKSSYEMPDGKYLAKFMGTTLKDATGQKGQDGNLLPPGMTWDFEIVEGEHTGKKADKLTGRTPTPKSGCGKFLAAITDRVLKDGDEIDLAVYHGKLYRITVLENRVSDNPAPTLHHGPAPVSAPVPASAPKPAPMQTSKQTSAPPPAPPKPPRPAPASSLREFWVVWDQSKEGDPEQVQESSIREKIQMGGHVPDGILVSLVGDESFGWKSLKDAGIDLTMPF